MQKIGCAFDESALLLGCNVTLFGDFDVYIGHADDLLAFFFHYSIFCLQTARFYAIISAVKFTDAQ